MEKVTSSREVVDVLRADKTLLTAYYIEYYGRVAPEVVEGIENYAEMETRVQRVSDSDSTRDRDALREEVARWRCYSAMHFDTDEDCSGILGETVLFNAGYGKFEGWRTADDDDMVYQHKVLPFVPEILNKVIDKQNEKRKIADEQPETEAQTTNSINNGVINMTNNTTQNRRIVAVTLIDNDAGIEEAAHSLVGRWTDIVTQDDDPTTVQEVMMNEDIAGALRAHNERRGKLVNTDILNRTGAEVKLRPVVLKDLTWKVSAQ